MVNKTGQLPAFVNQPHPDKLISLPKAPRRVEFFRELPSGDRHIRRCLLLLHHA